MRYDIKKSIYISNLKKIIILLEKCYNYCEIQMVNMMINKYENDMIISIIKYNIGLISNMVEINYKLNITGGTLATSIYSSLTLLYSINNCSTLSDINVYQTNILYTLNYCKIKMNEMLNEIKNISKSNLYYNLYVNIYNWICFEQISYYVGEELINDIDNILNETSIRIFDEYNNITKETKLLLLKQLISLMKIILFNTKKIDELFNQVQMMASNLIDPYLPINLDSKVVKNNYVYTTQCYISSTNLPVFTIKDFLLNTQEIIIKISLNPLETDYTIYNQAVNEGILVFLLNTLNYFEELVQKIVLIYIILKSKSYQST
jgi:hypothetical protein